MPAVAGDLVYIGSCAGKFYALDKTTDALRWSYDIKKDGNQQSFHGNALFVDDLVLIGTDKSCAPEGIGHVYAFNKNTGVVRWKYRTTSASTDIVQAGSRIYFGSIQDTWTALNLKDGSVAWSFATAAANPDCNYPKSPVTDGVHLYVAALDGNLYSFDAENGKIAWKQKLPAEPSTSLVLKGGFLTIGASNNHIYRLKTDSGAIANETTMEAKPVGRPVIADNAVLFFLEDRTSKTGEIVSLSNDLQTVRWAQRFSPEAASERPYTSRGLVIAGNCRGELSAFRATDGAPQWKLSLKGCIRSVGDSGDMLFAGAQEGTVYALHY